MQNQKTLRKKAKKMIFSIVYAFFDEREKVLSGFKSKKFPIMTVKAQSFRLSFVSQKII